MVDSQRTLTLAIKADIEIARTQLENLVGVIGKSATEVDTRLTNIENAFSRTSNTIGAKGQLLATTIGSTIGSTLGTLLGRIPGELLAMGQAAVESAGSIKNTAESLGIGTDALQDFRLGAAKAGVEVSRADSALETFQKTSGKAAAGNKAAADAFKAIGVDIADTNGRLKPFETLLGEVADGLAKLPDPARQAAEAQKLFGATGTDLLPFLRQGADGINELAAANELLGLKLSPETIKRLDDLGSKADAVSKVFTAQMATAIASNADAIIALGDAAGGAVGYLSDVLAYVKGLSEVRLNEGWSDQFFSSFERTTALGKPGGKVQIYGQEYAEAKRTRQEAEGNGYPEWANGAAALRMREDAARTRYLNAIKESEAGRSGAAASAPGVKVGGVVVPPPTKPPPAARVTKARAPFDLQGGIDAALANPATISSAMAGQADDLAAAIMRVDGAGISLEETLTRAFDRPALDDFANSIPSITDGLDDAKAAGDELTRSLAFGLAGLITASGDFGDKMVGTLARIGESMIQSGLLSLLSGGTQGTSFGTMFKGITSLFGGARAEGGPVTGGVPYLVGERGPEIVVPGMSGNVIPNHALRAASGGGGRGGGPTIQNFDLRGAMVTEDVMARIDAAAARAAQAGAVGGMQLARADRARAARKRLGR